MKKFLHFLLLFALQASAQTSPLNGIQYGVVLEHPAMKDVVRKADIPYLSDERGKLHLDAYLPPDMKKGEKRPAIVFLNAIGERAGQDKVKSWGIYTSWPRLVAAHGYVGISMECDGTRIFESLAAIFDFIVKNGAQLGIDHERLGVYSASANAGSSMPYLFSEQACKGIKAVAFYYGSHVPGPYPKHLPVLTVLAEGDLNRFPDQYNNLLQEVLKNRAPWTIKMATGQPHGFDATADTDEARRIIMETISFWKNHLDPVPAPSWQPSEGRAVLAAQGIDPPKALEMLRAMSEKYPDDLSVRVGYADQLHQAGRLKEAEAIYEKLAQQHPKDLHIVRVYALLLYQLDRDAEAERWLAAAAKNKALGADDYESLAYSLIVANKNEASAKCYEAAIALTPKGLSYYNLACAYSKMGQKDKALAAVENAWKHGYVNKESYQADPDLDALRGEVRFKAILEQAK